MRKICLITYSDDIFRLILRAFETTKVEYCKKNNIDFYFEEVSGEYNQKLGWRKLNFILKYLELGYDYVIITDYDSVIIDINYNINSLIKASNNADIICSALETEFVLLGCSIFKNTPTVKELLTFLLRSDSYNNSDFLAEEKIFNDSLSKFPLSIFIDPNINCIYNIHQLDNPFLLHYAGVSNPLHIKYEHAKRYNTKR